MGKMGKVIEQIGKIQAMLMGTKSLPEKKVLGVKFVLFYWAKNGQSRSVAR